MRRIFNETVLKIAAIITMTCDHLGVFLWMVYFDSNSVGYNVGYVLRIVGRLALPLYIFMLVEGLRHTSNRWKYCGRIAMIGLPITVFELIAGIALKDMTIMPAHAFTELMLFALIACLWKGKWWQKTLSVLPIGYIILSFLADLFTKSGFVGLDWFPQFLWADYDIYGFSLFLAFYFAYPIVDLIVTRSLRNTDTNFVEYKQSDDYRKLSNSMSIALLVLVNVIFWVLAYFLGQNTASYFYQYHVQTYAVICVVFFALYNGKRGYDKKWFRIFNYLYYPVHMIIIYGIFMLLFWM